MNLSVVRWIVVAFISIHIVDMMWLASIAAAMTQMPFWRCLWWRIFRGHWWLKLQVLPSHPRNQEGDNQITCFLREWNNHLHNSYCVTSYQLQSQNSKTVGQVKTSLFSFTPAPFVRLTIASSLITSIQISLGHRKLLLVVVEQRPTSNQARSTAWKRRPLSST